MCRAPCTRFFRHHCGEPAAAGIQSLSGSIPGGGPSLGPSTAGDAPPCRRRRNCCLPPPLRFWPHQARLSVTTLPVCHGAPSGKRPRGRFCSHVTQPLPPDPNRCCNRPEAVATSTIPRFRRLIPPSSRGRRGCWWPPTKARWCRREVLLCWCREGRYRRLRRCGCRRGRPRL